MIRVLLCLMLFSCSAAAQTPSPWRPLPLPPGPDRAEPLRKGEAAPYDGVLFDLDTAKRWGGYLEQYQGRLLLEREHHDKLLALELRKVQETQALLLESKNKQLLRSLVRIQELEREAMKPVPFYKSPLFGAALGVIVTLAGGATVILLTR